MEGALCGLPILYVNSGALPEYCNNYGLEFTKNNLIEKIEQIATIQKSGLVEPRGIEPLTSCMPCKRSPS